jgi:dihydrodipicolinate reductase
MGGIVEALAPEYGSENVGNRRHRYRVRPLEQGGNWVPVDVAIDYSFPTRFATTSRHSRSAGMNGSSWETNVRSAQESEVRSRGGRRRIGRVVAPNFSTRVVLFERLISQAQSSIRLAARIIRRLAARSSFTTRKRTRPSGTALLCTKARRWSRAGTRCQIDVSSTRAGHGSRHSHTWFRDGPSRTIILVYA